MAVIAVHQVVHLVVMPKFSLRKKLSGGIKGEEPDESENTSWETTEEQEQFVESTMGGSDLSAGWIATDGIKAGMSLINWSEITGESSGR